MRPVVVTEAGGPAGLPVSADDEPTVGDPAAETARFPTAMWALIAIVVSSPTLLADIFSAASLENWATIFLSLTLQALPFLALGVAVSAALSALVPATWLARALPRRTALAVPVAGLAGAALPGCECSSVPVAGRLVERGAAPAAALTFLPADGDPPDRARRCGRRRLLRGTRPRGACRRALDLLRGGRLRRRGADAVLADLAAGFPRRRTDDRPQADRHARRRVRAAVRTAVRPAHVRHRAGRQRHRGGAAAVTGARTQPSPVMRRTDAAGLLAALGVLVLWLGLSDRILRYLRPTMRTWLVVTGVLLVVLAVAVGVSAWRDHRAGWRQPHRSGLVGWLIVLPVLVALCVDARALGAYTIRLGSTYTKVSDGDFDLESHLRSHSFTGQAAELQLHQFLSAGSGPGNSGTAGGGPGNSGTAGGGPGNSGTAGGGFDLARLMIGCCAGDAVGLVVHVADYRGEPLADDAWVEVTGTFRSDAEDTGPVGQE